MYNNEVKQWRWTTVINGAEKDITHRKFILWGCGDYICDFANSLQLEDLLVIDNDIKKQGKLILLSNNYYEINSPDILANLHSDEYIIIITVQYRKVVNNIIDLIQSRFPDWINCISECVSLNREYNDIGSALMCDPFVHNKIHVGHLSIKLPNYINIANKILENNVGHIDNLHFSIVKNSSRIIFVIKDINNKFVLHFPYHKNYISELNIKENYEIRQRLKINEGFIIYEDCKGFILSRFMESVEDFSDSKLIEKILWNIKNFHCSGERISVKMVIFDMVEDLENKVLDSKDKNENWYHIMHSAVIPETKQYKESIIHGDFSYGNILHKDNYIQIIDWTSMCMGDPMLDVCLFYYYVSKHWYHDFHSILCMYYHRPPNIKEYVHAKAWLILISYWKYLEELQNYGSCRDVLFKNFLKIMKDYLN